MITVNYKGGEVRINLYKRDTRALAQVSRDARAARICHVPTLIPS